MAISLGKNIESLRAQRNLGTAIAGSSTVLERLGSGLRLNHASDDPAALAVASSLNASSRVFTRAIRNLQDGISVLSVAEASVKELKSLTLRQEELATQSANGVYSSAQRQALDAESRALTKEYDRIILSTKYNGLSLLDGRATEGIRLQGGYGLEGSINVEYAKGLGRKVGDGSFSQAVTIAVSLSARHGTVGDFDGNGTFDVVIVNASSDKAAILRGNGDGTFKALTSFYTGDQPYTVTAADLNNDGRLDLAVGNYGSGQTTVHLGNGNGSFKAGANLGGTFGKLGVAPGDFNKDGWLDLVSVSYGVDQVRVNLNVGGGSFAAGVTYAEGDDLRWPVVGDFNNDGNLDFVAVGDDPAESARVYLGNGNGTFRNGASYSGFPSNDAQTADLNGDGFLDLVVTGVSGELGVRLGVGNGTFGSWRTHSLPNAVSHFSLSDFNEDGITDIAASSTAADKVFIRLGNGNGSFRAGSEYDAGVNAGTVLTADFNQDGVDDLLALDNGNNRISILMANGDHRNFAPTLDLSTAASARSSLDVIRSTTQRLSSALGEIGAAHSRIVVAMETLRTGQEGTNAAVSRLQDADVASELSLLLKQRIVSDVAASILAQANQIPSLVLDLL